MIQSSLFADCIRHKSMSTLSFPKPNGRERVTYIFEARPGSLASLYSSILKPPSPSVGTSYATINSSLAASQHDAVIAEGTDVFSKTPWAMFRRFRMSFFFYLMPRFWWPVRLHLSGLVKSRYSADSGRTVGNCRPARWKRCTKWQVKVAWMGCIGLYFSCKKRSSPSQSS